MRVFTKIQDWQNYQQHHKVQDLGFVPTMGNLHAGHLALVQKSKIRHDATMVSIFVNHTQFNNPDDFNNYPQTLEADLKLLEHAKVNYCLVPPASEIYPDNFNYKIIEDSNNNLMEGKFRPGHYTGVLTVVLKLLNIVSPNICYLGEKDYQQYAIVKGMAEALFLRSKIELCTTVREDSGLALSSRNNRLDTDQKLRARQFAQAFLNYKDKKTFEKIMKSLHIKLEYLEEHYGRRFVAVYVDEIRLIDNYQIMA
jgi:pantoate--beta-alanine ligase